MSHIWHEPYNASCVAPSSDMLMRHAELARRRGRRKLGIQLVACAHAQSIWLPEWFQIINDSDILFWCTVSTNVQQL